LQYGWTLFVNPIDAKYHWGREAIQFAFTLFVLIETWLVPVEGYLVDRFGPRWVVLGGGILVGRSPGSSIRSPSSLPVLYVAAAHRRYRHRLRLWHLRRQRAQVVPGPARHRRRLTAAGFGAGAALTVVPISNMIASAGYEHAFLVFGLIQGGIVFVLAWLLLPPPAQLIAARRKPNQTAHGYTPAEVLRSPVFYVLYSMFVLIAAGGLTMTASMAPIAKDFKIEKTAGGLCSD
jgi:OFA family oxalate/formate antiporter-like MFS transporter